MKLAVLVLLTTCLVKMSPSVAGGISTVADATAVPPMAKNVRGLEVI